VIGPEAEVSRSPKRSCTDGTIRVPWRHVYDIWLSTFGTLLREALLYWSKLDYCNAILSTSQFHPSLKLISSTNHFLLSLFHALTSLLWLFWPVMASGLPSHFRYRCKSSSTISFTCFAAYTKLAYIHSAWKYASIYLHKWLAFTGKLNLLTVVWGNYYYYYYYYFCTRVTGEFYRCSTESSELLDACCTWAVNSQSADPLVTSAVSSRSM